jgi:hypothetical protein
MKNIRVIEIETTRMMNIQLIVYKIARAIAMIDKISKNVMIEMIVWELTFFLVMIDGFRDF